jgi:hypothetical protein
MIFSKKPKASSKKPTSNHKTFTKELLNIGYLKNRGEEEKRLQKLGMTKDHELSQKKDKVYVDKNGKAHVVYKGTDPTDIRDLATDAALAVGLGRFTSRFRKGKRLAKKAEAKYGADNTAAYGHSLGGSLATESGIKERITYNKGVGIGGIGKQMRAGQTDYRNKGDVVSVLSKFSKYKNKSGDSGGTHNERVTTGGMPLAAHALDTLK